MSLRKDAPPFQQVPHGASEHPIFTGVVPFGMISGEAPRFPSAPGGHEALKQDLTAMGLKHEETEGRYGGPERSFIVHGPTREQMFALGKKYGQESVIHSQNGKHQMLYTNGPNEGKHHPSLPTYDYWHEGDQLPEDYYTKIPSQGAVRLHFDFNQLHHEPLAMPSTQPMGTPQPMAKTEAETEALLAQHVGARSLDNYSDAQAVKDHLVTHHGLGHLVAERLVRRASALSLDDPTDRHVFASEVDKTKNCPTCSGTGFFGYQDGDYWDEDNCYHCLGRGRDTERPITGNPAQAKADASRAALEQHLAQNPPGAPGSARPAARTRPRRVPDWAQPRSTAQAPTPAPASTPAPTPPKQADTGHNPEDPMNTVARFRNLELHERQQIGHTLYKHLKKLTKAYTEIDQPSEDPAPAAAKAAPQATPSFSWVTHPHAYDWHDGHTDHHFPAHAPGGVAVMTAGTLNMNPALAKNASPESVAFGSYGEGPSNLKHYDYGLVAPHVDKLLADHGYQVHSNSKDHGKKNYNTKHLYLQASGDPDTDSYRKVHELAHALTQPEVNATYGEGKRTGKLGHHRTLKEAMRAMHWEWLATHKQRELNKQLGIEVPEETFNRELNTVLHDAAYRISHGAHKDLAAEGFTPHSHKVPLETALGVVKDAARNLGLQGETETVAKNELSTPEALHYLHDELQKRIDDFATAAVELRKKETAALEKKSPPGRKEEVEKLKAKGLPASEAFGIAWKQHNEETKKSALETKPKELVTNKFHGKGKQMGASVQPAGAGTSPRRDAAAIKKDDTFGTSGSDPQGGIGRENDMSMKEKKMKKNVGGRMPGPSAPSAGASSPMPPPPPAPSSPTLPGEIAKKDMDADGDHDYMCKCAPCGKLEHYAKSALSFNKSTKEEDADWEADKVQAQLDSKKQKQSAHPYRKTETKKAEPNTAFNNAGGKGKLPPKSGGEKVSPKNHAEGGNTGEPVKKAGMAMGGAAGAAPAMPKQPKMAGGAIPPPHPGMKPMKLPGVASTPKPAAAPKPAMGAGTPSPVTKQEMKKAGPTTLGPRAMEARKKFGERTMNEQAAKRPIVAASAGKLMDSMLAGPPSKTAAMAPGTTLPATQGAVPGVGHKPALPAQGVQTMAERVASKMPAGPSAFTQPPPAAKPKLPGVVPQAAAPSVPSLHSLAAAHTAPKLPGMKPKAPVQTMTERVASKMPTSESLQVPGEKSHQQLIHEARKAEPKANKKPAYAEPDKNTKTLFEDPEPKVLHPSDKKKMKKSELGSCALCKKAEHIGPCK